MNNSLTGNIVIDPTPYEKILRDLSDRCAGLQAENIQMRSALEKIESPNIGGVHGMIIADMGFQHFAQHTASEVLRLKSAHAAHLARRLELMETLVDQIKCIFKNGSNKYVPILETLKEFDEWDAKYRESE